MRYLKPLPFLSLLAGCGNDHVIGDCVKDTRCLNADGDAYSDHSTCQLMCPEDNWDIKTGVSDCDDLDPLTFPGAEEFCDGKDNDCDGGVDEAPVLVDCLVQAGGAANGRVGLEVGPIHPGRVAVEDLVVVLGRPAQERHEVDDRGREKPPLRMDLSR